MSGVGKKVFEVIGEVEWVNFAFYVKKNGTPITSIRLRKSKHPYVDWKHKVTDFPRMGQMVRIEYTDWAPRGLKIGFHHVIESYQKIPTEASVLPIQKE